MLSINTVGDVFICLVDHPERRKEGERQRVILHKEVDTQTKRLTVFGGGECKVL